MAVKVLTNIYSLAPSLNLKAKCRIDSFYIPANFLQKKGVRKGDRVMIYIPNCIQWVIGFLAIQKIGAVLVPISPIYTSYEIEYMIRDSGVETVMYSIS